MLIDLVLLDEKCYFRARSAQCRLKLALEYVGNRNKTPAWKNLSGWNCSERTFSGQSHATGHAKGYNGGAKGYK